MTNTIQTNSSSLAAQTSLLNTNNNVNNGFQRQASGSRINSARDDAAGLVIANQLSAELVAQNTGIRNANDGISIAQVAEGALQEVTNILQRSRELALTAASGQNSAEGREALNAEFQALGEEVARIAASTEFGGQNLLADNSSFAIQVGAESGDSISVETPNISTLASVFNSQDLSSADNASAALDVIDQQIVAIDLSRTELGATQNQLTSSISNIQNNAENTAASRSRISDFDFASGVSEQARNNILQQVAIAVQGQANITGRNALQLLSNS